MENEPSLHEVTEVMDESFSANGFSTFPFGATYKSIQHKSSLMLTLVLGVCGSLISVCLKSTPVTKIEIVCGDLGALTLKVSFFH